MHQSLSPGTFYLFCTKTGGLGSTFFGSLGRLGNSGRFEKSTTERIRNLIRDSNTREDDTSENRLGSKGAPATWRLGCGSALVVHYGLAHVVGNLQRVLPSVYHDTEHNTICVFQGYLSNLDELCERYDEDLADQGRKDPRVAAAQVLCRMFTAEDEPLILLSELQGQYAFAVYDPERRQVLVARDSSGKESLFLEIGDDGSLSVSNARLHVASPDGFGNVEWEPLPPGHFVSGKPPRIQQFALTPAQLSEREYFEGLDGDLDAASPHGSKDSRRSLSDELTEIGILN